MKTTVLIASMLFILVFFGCEQSPDATGQEKNSTEKAEKIDPKEWKKSTAKPVAFPGMGTAEENKKVRKEAQTALDQHIKALKETKK